MAGLLFDVTSGEVTLAANTARTLLQIKAPANQGVLVWGLHILGKQAAGGTDPVVKVRITRSTANFGTGTAAATGKRNPSLGWAIQSTCTAAFSVEPTAPADAGRVWEVPPQSGLIEFYPPAKEYPIPAGQSLQFEATSTGTPTLTLTASCEE